MRRSCCAISILAALMASALGCDGPLTAADGGQPCASDRDCDDGVFCNGAEACDPGAASADARGCVEAAAPPCLASQTCDEETDACLSDCEAAPDADGDGHDAVECGGADCDDADRSRFPGNLEVCDPGHHDEDCDPLTFGVRDADGDGYPDARCCNVSGDEMRCGNDCDDAVGAVHPGEAESCDTFDNDCDGEVDESLPSFGFHPDCDGDMYGAAGTTEVRGCRMPDERPDCPPERLEAAWATNASDCADDDGGRNPAVPEVCNGVDDDCDGMLDGPGEDDDGDGFADESCGGTDCDDERAEVHPGAPELCDGMDTDCDGTAPDDELDLDGDTYVTSTTCMDATLRVGDCDDTVALSAPGASEACNVADDDCDGAVDEGLSACDGVAAITVGREHACALRDGGSIVCWGGNARGELGDGTTLMRAAPAEPVVGVSDAVAISAGDEHTCVVRAGSTVACWGVNGYGQLGDGSTTDRSTPVAVPGVADAVDVVAASSFTCALRASGSVVCWGLNRDNQLGNGTGADSSTPVGVPVVAGAIAIAAGGAGACALAAGGSIWCWGSNSQGQLGDGSTAARSAPVSVVDIADATAIALGDRHACALRGDRTVWCWGAGTEGELGDGARSSRSRPVLVASIADVVAISAGGARSCARDARGRTYCWGDASSGALGDGSVTDAPSPVRVTGLDDSRRLAQGSSSSCALRADGRVACWGARGYGRLGDGGAAHWTYPIATAGLTDAVEVATARFYASCALRAGGTVACWGENGEGQLGTGTRVDSRDPVATPALTGVEELAMGDATVGAARADSVASWGRNSGQYGDGTTTASLSPVDVTAWGASVAIGAGSSHTCVVTPASRLWCAGENNEGALGLGSVGARWTTPTEVLDPGDVPIDAVDLDLYHNTTCVVRVGGGVSCWGRLGGSVFGARPGPPIAGLPPAVDIATSYDFRCAVDESGDAWCWGANTYGQLGDGTTVDRSAPVRVVGLTAVDEIDAGAAFACARSGGRVWCWGYRERLGDGQYDSSSVPVEVRGISDAIGLSLGANHACVVRASGGVACWGADEHGELGDGLGSAFESVFVTVRGLP